MAGTYPLQEICSEIQALLSDAVARCRAESISLSGGLDSSILASFLAKDTAAYVMVAKDFASTDLVNAQLVAGQYGLKLNILSVSIDDLFDAVENTITILKVFNPIEIRNNIVVYLAMKKAKSDGLKSIMTGDGADELFAGYNFFKRMAASELEDDLKRIWRVMHFPSLMISNSIGIELCTPFLDDKVVGYAKSIPAELKVRDQDGKKYGKWILRKAFDGVLPKSIVWGEKAAMQDGSGTSGLTSFVGDMISDSVYAEKSKKYLGEEKVLLQSKEALLYYEIYRKYFDQPLSRHSSENKCPNCNFSVDSGSHFCRMCGSFPI